MACLRRALFLVRTIFTGYVTKCYEVLFPQVYWLIIYGLSPLWDVFLSVT